MGLHVWAVYKAALAGGKLKVREIPHKPLSHPETGFASDSETGQADAGLTKKGQGSRCQRMCCSELGLLAAPDGPRIIMTGISVGFSRSGGHMLLMAGPTHFFHDGLTHGLVRSGGLPIAACAFHPMMMTLRIITIRSQWPLSARFFP